MIERCDDILDGLLAADNEILAVPPTFEEMMADAMKNAVPVQVEQPKKEESEPESPDSP